MIDERYRVDAEIGEGAMGIVYRGRHVRLDRDVAIKVLRSDVHHSDSVLRFVNEARLASSLKHQNLVDVMDCGTLDEGSAYYVMELLRGETLSAMLEREIRVSPTAAIDIVLQVIDGLRVAHAREVVHRDLKPENVFLCSGDALMVKLLDFGIARAKGGTNTVPGTVLGTPEFMAPEQARGTVVDTRADLYAVGAMLFEMLSGCVPLHADDISELLWLKINSVAPRLEQVAPHLAHLTATSALVADLLERDPANRVQTIDEVASRLRAARTLDGAADAVTPPAVAVVPIHSRQTRDLGSTESNDPRAAADAAVAGGWRRPGTRLPSIGLVPAAKGSTLLAIDDSSAAVGAGAGHGGPLLPEQSPRSPRQFVQPSPARGDSDRSRSARGAAPLRPSRSSLPSRAARASGRGSAPPKKRGRTGFAPLLLSIAALGGACVAAAFVFFGGRPVAPTPVNDPPSAASPPTAPTPPAAVPKPVVQVQHNPATPREVEPPPTPVEETAIRREPAAVAAPAREPRRRPSRKAAAAGKATAKPAATPAVDPPPKDPVAPKQAEPLDIVSPWGD